MSCHTKPFTSPSPLTVAGWVLFAVGAVLIGVAALPVARQIYDFRAFYAAGYMLLHQPHSLFDTAQQATVQSLVAGPFWRSVPFYHPAAECLLYAPFTLLPYNAAYLAYIAWNVILLFLCYVALPAGATKIPRSVLLAGFPVLLALLMGQNSILFLLLLCLAWRAVEREELVLAGLILALGLFKLPVALLLGVLLTPYLGRRFLLGFLSGAGAFGLLSFAITGVDGAVAWVRLLAGAASATTPQAQGAIAAYPAQMPTLKGVLYACGVHSLSVERAVTLLVLSVSAILIARATSIRAALLIAIPTALLLSPHLYIYDFTALLLPILLLPEEVRTLAAGLYWLLPFALFLVGMDRLWIASVIPVAVMSLSQVRDALRSPARAMPTGGGAVCSDGDSAS